MDETADDDRWATERARYLERTTDLRKKEALALAYSELGYSRSAIADEERLDSTKSTVKGWHERIGAQYGIHALNAKNPDDLEVQASLSEVTLEEVESYPRGIREDWYEMAARNIEVVPDSEDGTTWIYSKLQFDSERVEYDGTQQEPEVA